MEPTETRGTAQAADVDACYREAEEIKPVVACRLCGRLGRDGADYRTLCHWCDDELGGYALDADLDEMGDPEGAEPTPTEREMYRAEDEAAQQSAEDDRRYHEWADDGGDR